MCESCWNEVGSPSIVNDRTLKAASLIAKVYTYSAVGGNLHVQLDDFNLEDENFTEFKVWNEDSTPEQIADEQECFDFMQSLSVDERASAVAIREEWLIPVKE